MARPIPIPKRNRRPVKARLTTAALGPWWHPAVYLLLAALIITGDADGLWWYTFAAAAIAILSAALWGLHAYLGPLIEQERQRTVARAAAADAFDDAAASLREAAILFRGVADAMASTVAAHKPDHD